MVYQEDLALMISGFTTLIELGLTYQDDLAFMISVFPTLIELGLAYQDLALII